MEEGHSTTNRSLHLKQVLLLLCVLFGGKGRKLSLYSWILLLAYLETKIPRARM